METIESNVDAGELGLSIQTVEGKYNRVQEAIDESMKHREAADVKKQAGAGQEEKEFTNAVR